MVSITIMWGIPCISNRRSCNVVRSSSIGYRRSSISRCYNYSCLVDGGVCGVLGFDSGLVGLDVGAESVGVCDVVDDSDSSVGVAESVGAGDVAVGVSGFFSEAASGQVALVVAEVVVAVVL